MPIFDYLLKQKAQGKKWRDIPAKAKNVYVPLLNAFISEISRSNSTYTGIPRKMVEYLLGEFDFYKVISVDNKKVTKIQAYNLRGSLNQRSNRCNPQMFVPVSALPTRIVSFNFKPNSSDTVELYMDRGWQFSFRIHNASSYVEPSLKFDIQIIGMPETIISFNCLWS